MQLQDIEAGFCLTEAEVKGIIGSLNDSRVQILMILGMLNNMQKAKMDRELERIGLTSTQLQVLVFILHNNLGEHELTAKELQQRFRVSNPTMSGILKRLEKKDLIERIPGKADKRNKQIRIKGDIFSLCPNIIKERINKEEQNMFRNFTEEEIERLLQLLTKLLHNLDNARNEE